MRKTVFILGAGFSKPANAPLQSEIIAEIFKLKERNFQEHERIFEEYLSDFSNFLSEDLYIDEAKFNGVSLEDVFTPIDRCIIDGISYRSRSVKELVDLREKIYSLIVFAIKEILSYSVHKKDYIDSFASYIVNESLPKLQNAKHDSVAVISTNWDILLDNSLKRELEERHHVGVVDYCCYVDPLQNDDSIKPGLFALGQGLINVKLLKLHGSMNWLNCPKCQRVFIAFYNKISEHGIYRNQYCRFCIQNFNGDKTNSHALRSNLIMPTFLKDLSNFQLKLIWQNAGIELSEARKIVFIGYSLPQADFELRQLLSRMIPKDAIIEVVSQNEKNVNTEISHRISLSNSETIRRYQTFFGKRKISCFRLV